MELTLWHPPFSLCLLTLLPTNKSLPGPQTYDVQ